MNLQKKLSFLTLALALVLVVAAAPANAQQLYKATFELPFEAQFGSTTVEPGQYSIVVEQSIGQKMIRLRGQGDLAILLGTSVFESVHDNGRLIFVNVDGVPTLRKFEAGALGRVFEFPLYKSKGGRTLQGSTTSADQVVATH